MRRRVDTDAVYWCAAAFAVYIIGTLPVAMVWRAVGGANEGWGYAAVLGTWSALCAGVAVALLVRDDPARGLAGMLVAMWAVVASVGVLVAAGRFFATPGLWQSWTSALLYGASYGLIDAETLRPLVVLPPKEWFVAGVVAGYGVGRLLAGPRTPERQRDHAWWLSGVRTRG